MILYSPDWINIGFSFILLTVNPFRHSTLNEHGLYFLLFVGALYLSLPWYTLCVFSSFVIILKRKRELVALLLLSYGCLVIVNVLWLFLTVPWVGLQCDCGISRSYSLTFF